MNGFVSGSGWTKFIVSCPFQLGSLRHSGYGTLGLKCVSRSGVVQCSASVNTPLPLASFIFSNCPTDSVFISPTFGLMTTPPLLGLVTGELEHFPCSLSLSGLASCPSWTSSFAIDWEWKFRIWVCNSNFLRLVNTFSSNAELLGSGRANCYCGLEGCGIGGSWKNWLLDCWYSWFCSPLNCGTLGGHILLLFVKPGL